MQGILHSHFKTVETFLRKLQQDDFFNLPCTHLQHIKEHEQKLAEIYQRYQAALQIVSQLTREFDEHKDSVKRLTMAHKQCKKQLKKIAIAVNTNFSILILSTLPSCINLL